jgi:hypothetical protein
MKMKKIIFYISVIISVILLVNIFQILTNDFERLTEYGFGYLIGKVILFIFFLTIVLMTKKSVLKKKET